MDTIKIFFLIAFATIAFAVYSFLRIFKPSKKTAKSPAARKQISQPKVKSSVKKTPAESLETILLEQTIGVENISKKNSELVTPQRQSTHPKFRLAEIRKAVVYREILNRKFL